MSLRFPLAATAAILVMAMPSSHAATLVAQYQFQNASNLGQDSSGNANDLTTTVGTVIQSGSGPSAGSSAAVFDGASTLERLGGLTNHSGLSGFTLSAWVNLTGPGPSGYNGVISQDPGGCCVNRMLVSSSGNPLTNVGQHNDRTFTDTVPAYGTWFLYTLTAETSGASTITHVYLNGADVTGSPLTEAYNIPDLSTYNTYLGAGENGSVHFLNGQLADVRIYDGALTGTDVGALFDAGAASAPEPSTMALGAATLGIFVLLRRRA